MSSFFASVSQPALDNFDNHWEEWSDDFKNTAGWRDLVSLSPDQSNQVLNQKI